MRYHKVTIERRTVFLAVVALTFPASAVRAQDTAFPEAVVARAPVVEAVPGAHYRASTLREFFLGDDYRDLWTTSLRVPVLDLAAYAGGLEPFRRGGNASQTLHFRGADGRRYVFRSIDKNAHRALPPDLRHTPAGDLIRDQTSASFPAAGLLTAPLEEAVGLLHAPAELVVMPDDPRLGEFGDYAGMLGTIQERPDEGEDDTPGFAGSDKIVGGESLIERLEESPKHRLVVREYLAARLLDFVIGDTDRGEDQWQFARVERDGGEVWRPIPVDRDWAFMKGDGNLVGVARSFFPKLVVFGPRHSSLRGLLFMTRDFDRSTLVELPWAVWDSTVTAFQAQITDAVIDEAVNRLPPEFRARRGAEIAAGLRGRRDVLRDIARDYYELVAGEADVHATAEPERAEIDRLPDGSVRVRLYWADPNGDPLPPYFERLFVPAETREIRVHLHAGNDHAVVRGTATESIVVRVTAGPGEDVLVDSSRVTDGRALTAFYGGVGRNTMVAGTATQVDDQPFLVYARGLEREPGPEPSGAAAEALVAANVQPAPPATEDADEASEPEPSEELRGRFHDQPILPSERDDWVAGKTKTARPRDWGSSFHRAPVIQHRSGVGLIIGGGLTQTRYGFRRLPHAYRVSLNGLFSVETGGFGIELDTDVRPSNASLWFSLLARATQFESIHFSGFGNDSPRGLDGTRVRHNELLLQPAVNWGIGGRSRVSLGPVMRYRDPTVEPGSPISRLRPLGFEAYGQVGAQLDARLDFVDYPAVPHRGLLLLGSASGYSATAEADRAFGQAYAEARGYLPLARATLALRAGAQRVWGDFPIHEAAFLGGRETLRGFRPDRFAGDASLFGGAELRVPLARVELFTRGDLGVLGLVDAGRLYFDGESPGGWHTGVGGGLWFASLGRSVSVTYASGEEGRLYFSAGLPF